MSELNILIDNLKAKPQMCHFITSRLTLRERNITFDLENKQKYQRNQLIETLSANNSKMKPSPKSMSITAKNTRIPLSFQSVNENLASYKKPRFNQHLQIHFDNKINSLKMSLIDNITEKVKMARGGRHRLINCDELKINKGSLKMKIN